MFWFSHCIVGMNRNEQYQETHFLGGVQWPDRKGADRSGDGGKNYSCFSIDSAEKKDKKGKKCSASRSSCGMRELHQRMDSA